MVQTKQDSEKALVAKAAVTYVKSGMKVGLGTGSTSTFMIQKLGKLVQEGLSIVGVPSSERTAALAKSLGIPLSTLAKEGRLDINIDGADEFDSQFRLIKGGGGALLREKILAHNATKNIIISDSSKQVSKLGKFKLPIETIPFATQSIINELKAKGLKPVLRTVDNTPYSTDQKNYIVNINIFPIEDIETLNNELLHIPGVVETGLFLNQTNILIMAKGNKVLVHEVRNS